MKNDELKDVLRWNRQVLKGTKDLLLAKVLDGHVYRGRLTRCPLCLGGKLKLEFVGDDGDADNYKLAVSCVGSFDEDKQVRLSCNYVTTPEEAPRWKPWYVISVRMNMGCHGAYYMG